MEVKLGQWQVGQLKESVIAAIIRRIGKVDLQEHTLGNHVNGAMLMGIWDNEFILEMKLEINKGGIEEEYVSSNRNT